MHADSGIQLRVGVAQDRRHRAAGGQPRGVDPVRIDRMLLHHLPRHAGQQRRLAASALLVAVLEPVPAALRIGQLRLRRVQHVHALRLGQLVHRGSRGEIVRILGTAMQHHDQRQRLGAGAGRDEQLVVAAAGSCGVAAADELRLGIGAMCRRRSFIGRRGRLDCWHLARGDVDDAVVGSAAGRYVIVGGSRGRWATDAERGLDGGGGCVQAAGLGQAGRLLHQMMEIWSHGFLEKWDQPMRSRSAALTAGLACSAPSTVRDSMVASASLGVTSSAMVASPSTRICSISPAALTACRSAAV